MNVKVNSVNRWKVSWVAPALKIEISNFDSQTQKVK